MTLTVEANSKTIAERATLIGEKHILMVTPPIGADYWLFRVAVSDKQALIAFPKFGTIGIGFQQEEDWNTNLPAACEAEEIFEHIACNKGDAEIPDERCIEAIRLIQDAIKASKEAE